MSGKILIGVFCGFILAGAVTMGLIVINLNQPLEQARADTSAMADRVAPSSNNNLMDPVVVPEAERRSELHNRVADEEVAIDASTAVAIAPPVVTEIRSANGDDPLTRELFADSYVVTPPARTSEPEPEPEPVVEAVVEPEPEPEPVVEAPIEVVAEEPSISGDWLEYYRNRTGQSEGGSSDFGIRNVAPPLEGPTEGASLSIGEYMSRPEFLVAARERNATLDAMYVHVQVADGPNSFGIYTDPVVVPRYAPTQQQYSAPTIPERSAARPPMIAADVNGQPFTTSMQPNPVAAGFSGPLVLARGGDITYASLLYGFDSTDLQGVPIYAVISDYLPNGVPGPLNGARIQGEVQYSREDASIVFRRATLSNGLEIPINAIAISDRDGRTGVAARVNRHRLERFGSLFLAGLIEGYGEVAQIRLNDSGGGDTTIINSGGGTVTVNDESDEPTDDEILAGAIRPIGDRLGAAAAQNYNRPFTITAPAGMGFSLVFLNTIVTSPDDITGRAFNPRTGNYEAVSLDNNIQPSGAQGAQGQSQPVVPSAIQDAVNGQ